MSKTRNIFLSFFIRETQISKAEPTEICKSNNPDEVGGYKTLQLCCGKSFSRFSGLWGFIPVIAMLTIAQAKPQEIALDRCIEAALSNNPEIKQAANESSIAAIAVNTARSERYTSIAAEASGGFSDKYSKDKDYKTGYAKLNADQLLWQNQRVTSSVEQARFAGMASKASLEARKQEIIVSVKTVYYTCQQEDQLYQIAMENIARAEMFLDYARERYNLGIGRKSDVLKAESDLAEAKFERNSYLNSFRKSQNDLAMLTSLAPEKLSEPDSTWQADLVITSNEGVDSLLKLAFIQYPELQAIDNLGSSQQAKIKETQAAFYPGLSLNAGYEWSYNPILQKQQGWYTMLTLRWSIFSGNEKRSRLQSELIRKESYENQAEEIRNYLVREVSNRLISLIEARDQISLTRSLMRTTSENLETARAQYKAGTGSMLELTDARITDLAACQNHIKAITDYRIAMANLERLTGKSNENE